MINLISDTVTRPVAGMLEAMMQAEVGDDVFGDDPAVNALEARVAEMFGYEAAVFCPSGTMTNQIALRMHTQPLDEVVCERLSHIYQYEVGGYAYNSGLAIHLIDGEYGKMRAEQVEAAVKPEADWLPRTRLVVLENTANKGGGSIYRLEEVRAIREVCDRHGLKLHLDGARIFNALVETGETAREWGEVFDSVSVCLSKGLGAPVGSLLAGSAEDIRFARKVRKLMGGGMRQAGYLAAAGLYALEHHIDRLKEDHGRARILAEALERQSYVAALRPVQTNILVFDLAGDLGSAEFAERLKGKGILAAPFGPKTMRFVTHLDFSDEMLEKTLEVLDGLF